MLGKEHKFKDGDIVFYYDSQFSNIHRLSLRKDSEDKNLTAEVLYITLNVIMRIRNGIY